MQDGSRRLSLCFILSLFLSVSAQADNFLPFASSKAVSAVRPLAGKIVSLTPMISEWVAEISGDDLAKEELVGVSEYSNYPAYLKSVKTVGPYPQIQVEAVAALHPTLVLASEGSNQPEQIEKLKRLHLNVVVLKPEHFATMETWIRDLGHALELDKAADAAAVRWSMGIAALEKRKANQGHRFERALIEVQDEPLIAVGKESFLTDAFRKIGYQNIFGDLDQGYPKVSREAVLKENPDSIFILSMTNEENEKAIAGWKKFPELMATKNNSVRIISGDDFARCSLRLLTALGKLK